MVSRDLLLVVHFSYVKVCLSSCIGAVGFPVIDLPPSGHHRTAGSPWTIHISRRRSVDGYSVSSCVYNSSIYEGRPFFKLSVNKPMEIGVNSNTPDYRYGGTIWDGLINHGRRAY